MATPRDYFGQVLPGVSIGLMRWIGPSEAARVLSISRTALRRQLERLEDIGAARQEGGRWKLRREGLELAYDEVVRPCANSPRKAEAPAPAQPTIPGTDGPDEVPPPARVPGDERQELLAQLRGEALPPGTSRTEAERIRAIAQARLAQLDVEDREGRLVDADAVGRQWFEAGRRVRDQVLSLPARISADLAAEVDPVKVAILLEQALTQCLEAMDGAV